MDITIFGDSVMKGVEYIDGKYQVAKTCFVKAAAYTVDARCRFGCTSQKGLALLGREAERCKDGGVVLLEYGGNDADFDWAAVAARPDEPHLPRVSVAQFEAALREMVGLLKSVGARPALMTLPPIDPYRYFEFISKNKDREGLLRWLGHKERIYTFQEQYSLAVSRTGKACGVPVADVRAEFLRFDDFLPLMSDDGIHPNEEGHRLIADTLNAFFGELRAL